MRKKKLISTLISIFTVTVLMLLVTTTAFATDEPGVAPTEEVVVEPTQEVVTEPVTEAPTQEATQPVQDVTEPEEPKEETQPQTQSDERKDELPQVDSSEIVEPTKMAIPDVEVSDTSLIGGVIAWLCVAVGIAVIAGVLVSQRTRQVGTGSRDNKRR